MVHMHETKPKYPILILFKLIYFIYGWDTDRYYLSCLGSNSIKGIFQSLMSGPGSNGDEGVCQTS